MPQKTAPRYEDELPRFSLQIMPGRITGLRRFIAVFP
jgi:hypothetical protein